PSVTSNRRTGLDQAANAASMLACAAATSSGAVSPVTAKVSSSAAVSSIATLMCTTLPSGPATAFQRSAFCGASPGVNGTKARAALASGPAAQRRAVVQDQRTIRDVVRLISDLVSGRSSAYPAVAPTSR